MPKKGILFFLLFYVTFTSFSEGLRPQQDSIVPSEVKITSTDTLQKFTEEDIKYDTDSALRPIPFSQESIERYRNDNAFDYTERLQEENWWSRFKRWVGELWNQFWDWILGDYDAKGFLAFLIRTIPYLILIGILSFIIWLFFRLNPGARLLKSKNSPEVFFTEEEEIIKSKDIKKLIQKALDEKNYRLAVRYYYLFILKKLSDAELISYEFDKTNTDYFIEITSENINSNFRKATNLYDYIWYGSFDVTEEDYTKAQKTFVSLENLLKSSNV